MANVSGAMDVPVEDANGRLCQFNKTKMCKFFVLGKCTKGEQCPFAHESDELRKLPDLRCTKLCKSLIQTGLCTNKSCTYAHSKEELRSTGAFHKTKLCRFMQTGHCTLGAKCNFAHSAVELRDPETIDGVPLPPGFGWESMLGGLLSDDDEEDEIFDEKRGKVAATIAKEALDMKPAYVHFKTAPDSWTFGSASASILEETADYADEFASFEDNSFGAYWDYQSQLAANFPPSDAGCYSAEGSDLVYGAGFNTWANPWAQAGGSLPESSLFGGAFDPWDWRLFNDSVTVDQKDEWKLKSTKPDRTAPKMRSVRTSESTLCTLGDYAQV